MENSSSPQTQAFSAEVGKVLRLMISSLYTNRDIFLRELVANASDACDKLRYDALTHPELLQGNADLKITVSFDKDAGTLTISDNGIGMSREELAENLGTVARSGTQGFLEQMAEGKKDLPLIGQFGVGFYSAYMAADRVTVLSTRAGSNETWQWESDGIESFTVSPAELQPRGTRVTLHLKKDAKEYLDAFRLKHIVKTYADHIAFPVEIEGEAVNAASALWTRPRNEITEEQYREFYHHVAHSPDEPWLTLHTHAEGKLEYTALLFIPSMKPFDLFHPDRRRRVKLYVKRVFITDEGVELVPAYLRFLRGVVDCEDLPLNISRETLQANPVLAKVREALVKKVLGELKKRMEKNPENYDAFWKNFGAVLKEGLCEANTPREQILEVCRFASTQESGLTHLDAYLSRMKEGQEVVYYLTGERLEALSSSPQLEGFRKRGIEVLLLSDHVDDFWLTLVNEYKGKRFQSVTRADAEPEAEARKPEADALIARLKDVLKDAVSDVRITSKLDSSPACLAVEAGAMDIRLERFLVEQKQLPAAMPKILEINPAHPILKALEAKLSDPAAEAEIADVAWLLLDQARILEGEEVTDPAAFARRLNDAVQKRLAA